MHRIVLNAINKNNTLAAIIAGLILVIIVAVCGFFLARKWFAYKKSIEEKLEELEKGAEEGNTSSTNVDEAKSENSQSTNEGELSKSNESANVLMDDLNNTSLKTVENIDVVEDVAKNANSESHDLTQSDYDENKNEKDKKAEE